MQVMKAPSNMMQLNRNKKKQTNKFQKEEVGGRRGQKNTWRARRRAR